MPLRRTTPLLACIAMAGAAIALLASCAKDPLRVDRNRPPRTFLVAAPIDSTISHPTATGVSYSYRVHLYWRGEDPDGYVAGYLWAFDDSSVTNFHFTTRTDSIFDLTVNDTTDITGGLTNPGTTRFHTFFIRAVDNLGKPDPNLAIFNRTIFKASTIIPHVRFVGSLPGGIGLDTLSDGEPFKVCWTGDDSDGVVIRYKVNVGTFNGPLSADTCAFFNDENNPNSIGLSSGLYTMTVTAVDNALAVGKTFFSFVVNHDPETWFEPKGAPNGYYHPPFLNGDKVDESIVVPFFEGDTIPYRSTVWFNWNGEDLGRPGTPNNPNPETNCLNGFALELRGSRNNGEPYTIGYIDTVPGTGRRFLSNEPNYLRQAGFNNLVLDSIDPGFNMYMLVGARDCSNRGDGTRAAFRFNCNYRPFIDSLIVEESGQFTPNGFEVGRLITWLGHDVEDGGPIRAKIRLDDRRILTTPATGNNQWFVPDSTFANLSPSNPHSVEVWVIDRAEFVSDSSLTVFFDLQAATTRTTRRPTTRRP